MKIEIRKASEQDLPTLQLIAREVIDANYRPFLGDIGVDRFITSGAADAYVAEHLPDCELICAEDEIAGFAVCDGELIDLMMIAQHVHRKGLGSLLLQHCEDRLFNQFQEIRLESFEGNTQANNFYNKNAWHLTQRIADPRSGVNKYVFLKRQADQDHAIATT